MIRCYITDSSTLVGESLLDAIARNLAAGIEWIQIREKESERASTVRTRGGGSQAAESAWFEDHREHPRRRGDGCRSRRCSFTLGITPGAILATARLPGRRFMSLGGGSTRRGGRRRRLRRVRTRFSASLENRSRRAARSGRFAACGGGSQNSSARAGWSDARKLRRMRFRRRGWHRRNNYLPELLKSDW